MNEQELTYCMALTMLDGLGIRGARQLLDRAGSATEIFAHSHDIRAILPDATDHLQQVLAAGAARAVQAAQLEAEVMHQRGVQGVALQDDDYPWRLRECGDAPLVLYRCGHTDMNRAHIVSIIGTRKCTEYGRELCSNFMSELKTLVPDTLIVSGLAYGIDIQAHRGAIDNGLDTMAVLAHGLDIIYPSSHRQTAAHMALHGGALVTEYPIGTRPEAHNFRYRNRIVAGISDACIVVESAAAGGSLITARFSSEYNREVFAFPGKVYDTASEGCNNLIRKHMATLITNAEDFAVEMGWYTPEKKAKSGKATKAKTVQTELFPELTPPERAIAESLASVEDMHTNQLSLQTGMSHSQLTATLFEMEMKGLLKALGGGRYRLIKH